jgi:hypothetical protein
MIAIFVLYQVIWWRTKNVSLKMFIVGSMSKNRQLTTEKDAMFGRTSVNNGD